MKHRRGFYEYLMPFLVILLASFVLLLALEYWSFNPEEAELTVEPTCITSSGAPC